MKNLFRQDRVRAMVIALFAVLLVFMTEQLIEYFSRERTLEHERSHVLDNLSTLRARLEGVVNANFFLVNGLTAVIASRPDIDQEGFAAIARNMVDERHALRNIAAAPNMVISLMYPLEGNEAAVGLDYLTHPTQRQAAMRARDSRQAVVAGPLPLQQGGTGIIVRVPVFLEQSRTNDEPQFWGLVSAVLDVDRLYQQASLADSLRDFDLAIRGKDGTGSRGSVFYGDTTIYDHQPVTLSLTLPGGSWQLAAIPRGGWGQQGAGTGMIRLMGLLSALVAAAMAYRMARNHQIIRETADRLQQSQQRLLEAQCLAKLGGWELDQLTNELRWSDEVFRIFEIDKPRFGASYDAFLNSIHPDDRDAVDAAFKRSLATGESYDITHRLLFPDGRIKYVHETCEIFRDANGKPLRSVGTVQDVTERKQAEIQARKNEILLDSVFRALPDLFFLMDPDGTIRDFRAQQKEDLYISPDVFLGHRMQDVLPDEVGELFLGKLTEVINQGELATYEYDLPMAGGIRRFEARLTRLPESTQIIAVVREITQQYQDRIALSSSELRYRQLFEHNPAPLLVYEKGSLRILAVNEAFVQQYGYSRDEALALRLTDLYPEVEKQCISELAANLNGLVYAGEWHHLRKDGSSIIIDARSHDLDYEGHPARIAVITDISERKRAVLALQESEERLRLALQSANQGLYDLDLRTGEASVSPEYAQMLGYDPETFHESNTAWRERLHPEDLARVSKVFEDYIAGKIPDYRVEFRQRTRDGQWKWILSIGKVQEWDAVGRPVRMLGTHTDITAMRQAEEEIRRLNLDLEKRVAERTAELAAANRELETFSYSVSHDLKAPLRGIDGYSRLLLEDHESRLDEEGKLFLGNIRRGVQQMSQLIEDLLAYSRMERRSLHSQPLDLSLQVATALNERLGDIEDRGMQVKVALHGITVQADPEGLAMVLRNLIDNALKFTRDSHPPKLTILAKVQEKSIIIGLADNGIGFDMQFHERIFEIFQRLQRAEDYPGTGVGLAIVRKTLQRMGGKVWAESAPGQGATFYLELPR